jgi:hypothetical protein
MANGDQGQGPTFQPFAPAPAPRPDQGPSAAPPDAGSWSPPGATPPSFIPQSRNPGQQRYFNVTPDRQPAEWGKPNWVLDGMKRYDGIASGPWAPQPHDVNNLVYQISHSLQQGGSMNVAALAASMGRNRGAFLKGYMQGQEWKMRMSKQQYELDAVRLADQQQKEATAAGEAIEANSDNPNQMWAELSRIADENNDQHLRTAIGSGKLDNVKKLLAWRDGHLLPLLQINEQRAKVASEQARIEEANEKIRTSKEEREQEQKFFAPVQTPAAGGAAPAGGSAPAGGAAPAGGQPPAGTAAPGPAGGLLRTPPAAPSQGILHAGRELQMGGKPEGVPDTPAAHAAVANFKQQLDDYMQGITGDANIASDQVMPMVRAANPAMADLTQGILDHTITPTAAESAKDPGVRMAENLARKINPNHTRDAAQRDATRERQDNQARLATLRPDVVKLQQTVSTLRQVIPRNVQDMNVLINLASKVNRTGVPVVQRWINAGRQAIEGDEDVTRFATQIESFQRDVGQLTRTFGGQGAFTVHAQRAMEGFVSPGSTPGQLRAMADVLKRDYENILVPAVSEINRVERAMFGDKAQPQDADDILATLRAGRPEPPPMPTSYRQVQ